MVKMLLGAHWRSHLRARVPASKVFFQLSSSFKFIHPGALMNDVVQLRLACAVDRKYLVLKYTGDQRILAILTVVKDVLQQVEPAVLQDKRSKRPPHRLHNVDVQRAQSCLEIV